MEGNTGLLAGQERETADKNTNIDEGDQGGSNSGCTIEVSVDLGRDKVKVTLPVESRYDVRAHGFWNQGTTVIFYIQINNLNTGSYMHMISEKALVKAYKDKK